MKLYCCKLQSSVSLCSCRLSVYWISTPAHIHPPSTLIENHTFTLSTREVPLSGIKLSTALVVRWSSGTGAEVAISQDSWSDCSGRIPTKNSSFPEHISSVGCFPCLLWLPSWLSTSTYPGICHAQRFYTVATSDWSLIIMTLFNVNYDIGAIEFISLDWYLPILSGFSNIFSFFSVTHQPAFKTTKRCHWRLWRLRPLKLQ